MSVNNQTREQHKQEKKEKAKGKAESEVSTASKRKRIRIRLIPLWLRLIIIVLLIGASVILGAIVGFSVIGDGEAKDVFEKTTWTYILDLIEKE